MRPDKIASSATSAASSCRSVAISAGGAPVLSGREHLPRLGFQAPGRNLCLIGLTRQLFRCPQVSGSRAFLMQVDQARGGQERQPAARRHQSSALGERRAGIHQLPDVSQMRPYPHEKVTRGGTRIGCREVIGGRLQPSRTPSPMSLASARSLSSSAAVSSSSFLITSGETPDCSASDSCVSPAARRSTASRSPRCAPETKPPPSP